MATKTLTITEDAYNLLKTQKLADESFSEEISRLLSEKKKGSIWNYYGILSEEDGQAIMDHYLERKKGNIIEAKKRLQRIHGIT
ncbi:antitoxin VapB family protein [Candidatus Woesearchaeota archaeon]|nr:antitoxin VapB family protein [Candidatus Woesearchaeota archaeon]